VGSNPRNRAGGHFGSGDILGHHLGGAHTMSAFYVIDTEAEKVGMMNIFGPYETRAAAEAFIRKDFADWWEESETPLKDRDAASSATYQILQLVAEVRPVGSSSLKVKLVEEAK
jgi:hypothetical protein